MFELKAKMVDIPITQLVPNTIAVQQAVRAELEDLFLRYRLPGDKVTNARLPISHIREAISGAPGEDDHVLGITDDIQFNSRDVPVLGTITFPAGAA